MVPLPLENMQHLEWVTGNNCAREFSGPSPESWLVQFLGFGDFYYLICR